MSHDTTSSSPDTPSIIADPITAADGSLHATIEPERPNPLFGTTTMTLKEQRARAFEIGMLYAQYGTLRAVAQHLGCAHERVRQILLEAKRQGWVALETRAECRTKVQRQLNDAGGVLQYVLDHPECLDYKTLAASLGTTYIILKKLLSPTDHRLLDRFFTDQTRRSEREATAVLYERLVVQIGHHPTDTELQQHHRTLSSRISRHFGGIRRFRADQQIKPPTDRSARQQQSQHRLSRLRQAIHKHGVETVLARVPQIQSWNQWALRLKISHRAVRAALAPWHAQITACFQARCAASTTKTPPPTHQA